MQPLLSALAFKYLFDWQYYLSANPEALQQRQSCDQAKALIHWIVHGRAKRLPCKPRGIEIGGSAHNDFYLNTINIDMSPRKDTIYKKEEIRRAGCCMPVDAVAQGHQLPFKDKSVDFVLASHVIEHFFDPIGALIEWARIARRYIYLIVPHRDRTFDKTRQITSLQELFDRHSGAINCSNHDEGFHYSVWNTAAFLDLCSAIKLPVIEYQTVDDKWGNGFSVVIGVGQECHGQ